jgi:hypothetical protein
MEWLSETCDTNRLDRIGSGDGLLQSIELLAFTKGGDFFFD